METIVQIEDEDFRTSVEFAEDVLTSPDLPQYADRARNTLLGNFYGEQGISTRDMWDVISLTASQFQEEIEELVPDLQNLYENPKYRELANTLFAASSNVATQLDLNLGQAIETHKHDTAYGRGPTDGLAILLTMMGAGTFDRE